MTKHLRIFLVMLLTIVASAGWANETVYKTLTFPDDNKSNNGLSGYTVTWQAKIGADTWNIVNFNNNNWNNWAYIKCGSKNKASIASIANSNAFENQVSKVVVKIDKVADKDINSISLVVATDKGFSNTIETINASSITTGDMTFNVSKVTKNAFYKLVFNCKKASDNGPLQLSKVTYYTNEETSTKKTPQLTFKESSYTIKLENDIASFDCASELQKTEGIDVTYSVTPPNRQIYH